MKIREVIQEFMPCEVCGNRDVHKFYFHVFVYQGSQPYVKCCECEEEFYSTKARSIISGFEDLLRAKKAKNPANQKEQYGDVPKEKEKHPLLKTLGY